MPWTGLPVGFADIFAVMASGLAFAITPVLALIYVARKRSMSKSDARTMIYPFIDYGLYIYSITTFISVYLLIIFWKGASWYQLGLVQTGAEWYWKSSYALIFYYSVVLILVAVVVAGYYCLKNMLDTDKILSNETKKSKLPEQPLSVFSFLGIAVLVPFAEEVFFRGMLYGWLRLDMSPTASTLISSVIFGICHGPSLNGILTIIMGIGLAVLYEQSGSILPCILAHGINNGLMMTTLELIRRGHVGKFWHWLTVRSEQKC